MSAILREVLAYCERTGTPETLLGRRTVGDSSLVPQMRRGRALSERNAVRLRAMMAKHPEGFKAPRTTPGRNPNQTAADQRTRWEIAAEVRQGSERLRKATASIAPASTSVRKLSHEEQVALILSGKAQIYTKPSFSRGYDYSLTGGSM